MGSTHTLVLFVSYPGPTDAMHPVLSMVCAVTLPDRLTVGVVDVVCTHTHTHAHTHTHTHTHTKIAAIYILMSNADVSVVCGSAFGSQIWMAMEFTWRNSGCS